MSPRPELWIVAGPNGAGKTTLTQRRPLSELLEGTIQLNADDKTLAELWKQGFRGFADAPAKALQEAFVNAANEVTEELQQHLRLGHKVCVETVLSTEKYKSIVTDVRQAGGFFGLIYVGLKSPNLSAGRIQTRVALGGHDVPRSSCRPLAAINSTLALVCCTLAPLLDFGQYQLGYRQLSSVDRRRNSRNRDVSQSRSHP
ncbi:MAG: zeta toxin family protein [Planctomycetaceae bacterium]